MNKLFPLRTILILWIGLNAAVLDTNAQDTIPKKKPNYEFKYKIALNASFSEGNVSRRLVNWQNEFAYSDSTLELATNPRYVYGIQNGQNAENELYTDLILNLFPKNVLYVLGFGTVEKSNLRSIDVRQQYGGGLGLHLIRKPKNIFSITNALIYEKTDFEENQTIETFRNSTRIKGKHLLFKDKLIITHLSFFQPSLQNQKNYRWSNLVNFDIPFTKHLSFQIVFENTYESIVAEGRKNNDSRLMFGFSIKS